MQARTQMLENLLQEMIAQEEIAKANQESDFSRLKGQLALPMQGNLDNTYNTPRPDGSGEWRGVWIHPKNKSPAEVFSIADGHVVFADWLLGYGLLTIVDHGHGFFSLYGHTHTLLRQPGDWVTAQTPIAVVKPKMFDSRDINGLYFEIRENSQALNPGQWLAKAK
jgi:septal ring factor EnvC (AmiA/AmiB activator)